jgi:flagella basal body P-ring formation protein FlgA
VTVQRQRKVYVPVRDLQRGEVITPADLEEREMLVDNEARDRQLLENPQEIYGHRARTTIRRNDPIKTFSVETNYILQRGDLVQVLVREKGMTLQTTGQAQSRGAVGEVIPIKATATGKLVRGKVLSRNLVELVTS